MTHFTATATGGAHAADRDEVRRALAVLVDPAQTFEIRGIVLGGDGKTKAITRICTGSDLDAAVEAADGLSHGIAVYWTINPVRPGHAKSATKKDIVARRWLFFDIDPVKPDEDVSATGEEKVHAIDRACDIAAHLAEQGWPDPVMVDSGNGAYLLYRIDLPADDLSRGIVKEVLTTLAEKFNDDAAKIDPVVHDAPRLAKLPGTWARKGPDTPDRPHRMARLIHVPSQLGVVTAEQLNAIGEQARKEASPEVIGHPFHATATDGTLAAYVRSAIDRECARVRWATPGAGEGRNNALNRAAFALATLSPWPEMDPVDAKRSLRESALQAGLGEGETNKTLQSGWEAGLARPRDRPVEPGLNGVDQPKPKKVLEKLTEGLDEIETEKVDWCWENRVAPGFISIFAGRSGVGKSFVTCDLVARLSRGEPPAFSSLPPRAVRTLFISEDSPRVMLGPRLIELKAVRKMVRFMKFEALMEYTIGDVGMLGRAYEECGQPGLIVIDPPSNFLGGVDEHRNAEVRNLLKALCIWIERFKVSCILITHINKQIGKGLAAVERIIGSVAWGSVARMTVAFDHDPNDPNTFLCGGTKNNLGEKAEVLAYRVVKTDFLATLEWTGKSETTMEDAMNQLKKKSRGACAVEWLIERFREQSEWESDELKKAASEAGLSKNALWSPEVNALPIRKRPRVNASGERYWVWSAEPGWPPFLPAQHRNGNVGNVGNVMPQPFD
jgi:hypothetical protein